MFQKQQLKNINKPIFSQLNRSINITKNNFKQMFFNVCEQ